MYTALIHMEYDERLIMISDEKTFFMLTLYLYPHKKSATFKIAITFFAIVAAGPEFESTN